MLGFGRAIAGELAAHVPRNAHEVLTSRVEAFD